MVLLIFLLLALAAGAANPEARPIRPRAGQRSGPPQQKTSTPDRQRGTPTALPGTDTPQPVTTG